MNGASEQSERSEAERCGASERSERCERTNIVSDRVACSKRDCLTRNAPNVAIFTIKNQPEKSKNALGTCFTFHFVPFTLKKPIDGFP